MLLNGDNQNQIIAFQPLDGYNVQETDSVVKEISLFFNKKVIVLSPIEIPQTFINPIVNQYSSDSIVQFLSRLQNDTIVEIVGLTHKPVFTIKDGKPGPYFLEDIFGMGYQPGNSCVVSDFKFSTPDISSYNHRLKTVIIHEIGHNMGLPHCNDEKCVMSENNGNVLRLDKSVTEFCAKCSKVLKR